MGRKDASKPPIDKYRKEIGKHDRKKGERLARDEVFKNNTILDFEKRLMKIFFLCPNWIPPKQGDRINKAEKRQREGDAAFESAVHKWPLLILGLISVFCGLLYLGLYFWLTVPENADLMDELSTGFAAWKAGKFPFDNSEPEIPAEGKSWRRPWSSFSEL